MNLSTVLLDVIGITKAIDMIGSITCAGHGVNSFILILLIGLLVTGVFVAVLLVNEKLILK